jgi:glycosyltransferase involved in cell wall biosynthesis
MHVLHVITNTAVGGAETMLHRLIRALGGDFSHEVASLMGVGPVGDRIRDQGVTVHAIGMDQNAPNPLRLLELGRVIRASRPDVIQTWMYHADLLGGLAAKAVSRARIVWGIHHTTLDRTNRWSTRASVAACARLSHVVPDAIVCVSRAARELHVGAGYAAGKFVVIPNGFDLAEFRTDPGWRRALRDELGVAPEAVLIGMVGRVAPQKDQPNFVRAAAVLARRAPEARFLLCGEGASWSNEPLARVIREQGLAERFLLLGRRDDVQRVMNALDVMTLASAFGEAFPLVIGEAMACRVPCVVTDVGDSAFLVGDAGRVVPPRDPAALARALEDLIRMGPDARARLGDAARQRIEAQFGLARIASEYADVYRRVAGASSPRAIAGAPAA